MPTPTWPLKLATLLFSGGLATIAVARAGCHTAPPPPPLRAAEPVQPTPRLLDYWGEQEVTPYWNEPTSPQPAAWFHLYTLARRLLDTPVEPDLPPRYIGGAKSDPSAWARDVAPDLPDDYFGGAKSDAEVWSGLHNVHPDPEALRHLSAEQRKQRGRR